ncbi:MAG: MFS transporter [Chloroflexi bacterium]|nr:MFS transporter [Chloroflexota bacterium]
MAAPVPHPAPRAFAGGCMPRQSRGPLFYGWIVVAVTFVIVLVSAGTRASVTTFIVPLDGEFGWNRAAIASAISVNLLLYGLSAPLSGRLMDRFGPRLVVLCSLVLLVLGVAGTLFMSQFWQFTLLWGILVGLGAGGSSSVLYATIASRWFVARRGLVLGFLGSANSTGQLIFLPLLMMAIVAFGWRAGALAIVAVVLLLAALPVLLWLRDDPADLGLRPYGAESAAARAGAQAEAPTVPLLQAVRTPDFWLLAGSYFVCGATANGLVGTHFLPHSIDHGIPEVTAAATLGIMGGMNFVGTLGAGWLTDRLDPRKMLAATYALRGVSLFVLPFVTDFSGLLIFAVVYGLDWFATVPPTVAVTARRFGKGSVGTIYGWIFASHQFGAAVSATMAGAIRVWLGDYQYAFLAGGVIAMIGASMALLIRMQRPSPTVAQPGQAVA